MSIASNPVSVAVPVNLAQLAGQVVPKEIRASRIPGVVADCDIHAGTAIGGGTPTDSQAALNAVIATASATNPVHLILDGGFAISRPLVVPLTAYLTISGLGRGTGLFVMSHSNRGAIVTSHFSGTDNEWRLEVIHTPARPLTCKNLVLRDFHINANRGTFPNGCSGPASDTVGDGSLPPDIVRDARGCQYFWIQTLLLAGIENLHIHNLSIYDPTTYAIAPYGCKHVTIDNCRIEVNPATDSILAGSNTAGIQTEGSCDNIHISNCYFIIGDDCIAINCDEAPGGAAAEVVISDCTFYNSQAGVRIFGKNVETRRIVIRNTHCLGTLSTNLTRAIVIGDEDGAGSTVFDANHSILIDGLFMTPTSSTQAAVWINGNCGVLDVRRVHFIDPTVARPMVKLGSRCIVSSLVMADCQVHRSESGSAACYALDATSFNCRVEALFVDNFRVTEQSGHTYADIPNLVYVSNTSAIGRMGLSGSLAGVGTVVAVASDGSCGPVSIDGLDHTSHATSPVSYTIFNASSTAIPVSVGRYTGTNLAGPGYGPVTLTGPGIVGLPLADSLVGDGWPYLSSPHSSAPAIKVGGVVKLYAIATAGDTPGAHFAGLFDGLANSHLGTPLSVASDSTLQASGSWTIGAFVRGTDSTAWATNLQPIVAKWGTPHEYILYLTNGDHKANVTVFDGTAEHTVVGTTVLSINTWYLIEASFDGTNLHLFVNGVEEGTPVAASVATSSTAFEIGGVAAGTADWTVGGDLAMVFKYSIALNSTQNSFLYNAGSGRGAVEILAASGAVAALATPDLLVSFEASGTLGLDSSTHARTLTNAQASGPTQVAGPA